MSGSPEVEELKERIRRLARRNDALGESAPTGASKTSGQGFRSAIGRFMSGRWLFELNASVVRWIVTARELERLDRITGSTRRSIDGLVKRQELIESRLGAIEAGAGRNEGKKMSGRIAASSQDVDVDAHDGPKAAEGLWFNDPIILAKKDGRYAWHRTSERIIEKAWVLRHLWPLDAGATVLDVGCAESVLPLELASNGFKVTGVDVRPFTLHHPNFRFLQSDIIAAPFEPASFDAAILLSTIEHIGLGWYGDRKGDDIQAATMQRMHDLLKPGGSLLLTVPFGKPAVTPLHRVFDVAGLRELLQPFKIVTLEYGVKLDDKTWIAPADEAVAREQVHDPQSYAPGAVALVACTKL